MFDDKDDFDEDGYLAALEAEEQDAFEVLLDALPESVDGHPPLPALQAAVARIRTGVADNTWPYGYFAVAARWKPGPPPDDVQCFVDALVCTMLPEDDVEEWSADELAAVQSLTPADWVGSVLGLVRAGPGASASPESLLAYIDKCPELEGERDPDDDVVIEHAFEVLLPLWEAIDVVDDQRQVTRLGVWALPQLLRAAWAVPN